jgi:CRP-like cAMP-binding protein
MTEIELKKHFEELITLNDSEFDYILSHFVKKSIKKHRFLIQESDEVKNTYWIKKGLLISTLTENDKEIIVQFAMENWWITDYQAYFTQSKAVCNLEALEDSEVFALSFDNREKLCKEFHKLEYFFRKKANSGYVALQKRLISSLTDDAKKRYELLLKQYPNLFQRVSKSTIASYLGVSRETLSRLNK